MKIPQQASYKKLKVYNFPSKIRSKSSVLDFPFLFNIVLEVLVRAINQEEIECVLTGKEIK